MQIRSLAFFLIFFFFLPVRLCAVPVTLKVIFPFAVDNVTLHSWYPGNITFPMNNQTGTNEFTLDVPGITNTFIFNISFDIPQYNIISEWTCDIRKGGIKYARVYINNSLLNNAFTIESYDQTSLDISIWFNSDGSIIPFYDQTHHHYPIDDRIPPEVYHRKAYHILPPGSDYPYVCGWMALITNNDVLDTCEIWVDYLQLFGRKNGILYLLTSDDYNTFDTMNDGGLYTRYPFFPAGVYQHDPMPADVQGGVLVFHPTQHIKKIWHWWNSTWHYLTTEYDSYRLECRIKITGHALVQGGIDFRQTASNPDPTWELGVSNWYFENNGDWQDVIFDSDSIYTSNDNSFNQILLNCYYNSHERRIIFTISTEYYDETIISLYNIEGKRIQTLFSEIIPGDKAIFKSDPIPNDQVVVYEIQSTKYRFSGRIMVY